MPDLQAQQTQAQRVADWTEDELELLIDEGRRQSDRQLADLEQIRGRAQWLFTTGAPIVVAIASVYGAFHKGDSGWWIVLWLTSLIVASYGLLGAAAIMTIRADFNVIDSAKLSGYQRPILSALAHDYAAMLGTGENTIATRVTVFWQSVVWLILGGYGALVTWLAVT